MSKKGLIRLLLFFLLPMYLVWLFRMDWNPNIANWPVAEIVAWLIATLIWSMAWGFAALKQVKKMRMMNEYLHKQAKHRQ
ncbi:hypothetical protein LJB93_02265 [Desulfovibrio sp. OttesenSCG-928-F07]|nr:hypothetical protein [Desulfovibrio sp. OttesenSCG-928-F07]